MAIPNVTVVQIVDERVTEATNLFDLDKDALQKISDNLCRPGVKVYEINYINPLPLTVTISPVPTILNPILVFGAKYQNHLLIACFLIRLYDNIQWVPIISNFDELYKYLTNYIKEYDNDKPNISKYIPIIKWNESFRDYLHHWIVVRNASLTYVTR